MKKSVWFFNSPEGLTVAELQNLVSNYEIDCNIPEWPQDVINSKPAKARVSIRAKIVADAPEHQLTAHFELQFEGEAPCWTLELTLPNEDAQWLIGCLSEGLYSWPPAEQTGAFGYVFKGNELFTEVNGQKLFRHFGNECPFDISLAAQAVDMMIKQFPLSGYEVGGFTMFKEEEFQYIVLFPIEEHGFTRHLCNSLDIFQTQPDKTLLWLQEGSFEWLTSVMPDADGNICCGSAIY